MRTTYEMIDGLTEGIKNDMGIDIDRLTKERMDRRGTERTYEGTDGHDGFMSNHLFAAKTTRRPKRSI